MLKIKTLDTVPLTPNEINNTDYNYQSDLTVKLDDTITDFNQEIINEIVLWKVNRFASFPPEALQLINKIGINDVLFDKDLTQEILQCLLRIKGVRLAMASTILRFRNPKIYQIIDQRVYRFLTGKELNYSLTDIQAQIELYVKYLELLKINCEKHRIQYELSDRIIYELDKKYNRGLKIKY